MNIAAIVLAAGDSTRMGRPKASLAWQGKTLLEYQINQCVAAGASKTIAVLGSEAERLLPLVRQSHGVSVIVNTAFRSGKCSSIIAGMMALPEETEAVIILAVDQPRPYRLLQEMMEHHRRHGDLITVPVHKGRRGHPMIFSRPIFSELFQVSEDTQGLRHVMLSHQRQVAELPVFSADVLIDLNNPEDYKKALMAQAGERSPSDIHQPFAGRSL